MRFVYGGESQRLPNLSSKSNLGVALEPRLLFTSKYFVYSVERYCTSFGDSVLLSILVILYIVLCLYF